MYMRHANKYTEEEEEEEEEGEEEEEEEEGKKEQGERNSTQCGVSTSAFDIYFATLTLWSSCTKVDAQSQDQIRCATYHRRNPDVSLNLQIQHAQEMQTK